MIRWEVAGMRLSTLEQCHAIDLLGYRGGPATVGELHGGGGQGLRAGHGERTHFYPGGYPKDPLRSWPTPLCGNR
ncbi:protein of unknown function [Candidatus Methylocalor cossyra]|uniref:Uncharacterized protein n=1 Tax=Candidatus Methylocalor cossyra TaxID=3108543 RepID=A0ABP1C750_9GAMM